MKPLQDFRYPVVLVTDGNVIDKVSPTVGAMGAILTKCFVNQRQRREVRMLGTR
jgi:hypothetical protein